MSHQKHRKSSISRFVSLSLLIISSLSILVTGYFWITSDFKRFDREAEKMRREYFDSQKKLVRDEVLHAVEYIEFKKSQTEMRLKESIRGRVLEAHAIATNLYRKHHLNKSPSEIGQIVKDALRPIRFNHGRGYFFAFNLKGIETLFPVRPEMEGRNMEAVTGAKGERVVPDMLDLVKREGEGFYTYTWTKPDNPGFFPKIAFVKIFEPLGWVIGTGEYLDDVEKDIQQEVLSRLEKIHFGKDGYLFAATWDGMALTEPWKDRNVYDLTDIHGLKIVQEMIRVAQNGGGYVEYVLPGHDEKKGGAKISFAAGIKDWQWYVGAGVFTDEVENVISSKQGILKQQIEGHVLKISLILLTLTLLVLLLNKFVSDRIRKNFLSFNTFFANASSNKAEIHTETLNFSEFAKLAESANRMIDERNRAESALLESRKRLTCILDSVNPGIMVIDPDTHTISEANQAAIDLFGLPGNQVLGRRCQEMIHTERQSSCLAMCLDSGIAQSECILKKADGTTIPILKACKRADIDGRTVIIVSFLDISSQKKLEEQLRHIQKMEALGTLSSGIAHDFNNILSIIIGNAEMACEDLPKENPVSDFVQEIRTAGLRAKGVVQQLLSFSRRTEEHLKPINIMPVVKEAVTLLQSTLPATIELCQSYPDEPSIILADSTQIHQIVINLCSNAAHAIGENEGEISITLENHALTGNPWETGTELEAGKYLKLSISDSGAGIDPEHMTRIFEPYFTTKKAGKGSGLGLSIVHGIVTRHRGAIRAQSQPGRTTFEIFFPAVDMAEIRIEETETLLPSGQGRILWVDDEFALASIGRTLLSRLGYSVEIETNPLEALHRFQKHPNAFDLVISDLAMPKMTGSKLIAEMKMVRPDLPVILCTGYNDRINEDSKKELGLNRLFIKPIDRQELALALHEILGNGKTKRI